MPRAKRYQRTGEVSLMADWTEETPVEKKPQKKPKGQSVRKKYPPPRVFKAPRPARSSHMDFALLRHDAMDGEV